MNEFFRFVKESSARNGFNVIDEMIKNRDEYIRQQQQPSGKIIELTPDQYRVEPDEEEIKLNDLAISGLPPSNNLNEGVTS